MRGWQNQMSDKSLFLFLSFGFPFFFMLVISWNVRGLGFGVKRRMVKDLVCSYKPEILFLQETKLKNFDYRVVNSIGGSWLSKGIGVDAGVHLGGY